VSVVAVASVKGSPGVTTVALALASWWPRPVVVIEADPAGGDLALRLRLPEDPGLVGLAAARRRRSESDVLEHYTQESPLGIPVVPAPAGAHQSAAPVSLLAGLPESRLTFEVDVLLDVGRLDQSSPARALAEAADALVWVCRPQLGDLAHLSAAVEHERSHLGASIVLNGAGPYPAEEVSATLGVTVLGHLPADPGGVAALWESSARTWARCALGRASRDLAHHLDAALAPLCEPIDAGSPSDSLARKATVPRAGTMPDALSAETTGPPR
jgi:Mrp family chromosome partitioning ATPase